MGESRAVVLLVRESLWHIRCQAYLCLPKRAETRPSVDSPQSSTPAQQSGVTPWKLRRPGIRVRSCNGSVSNQRRFQGGTHGAIFHEHCIQKQTHEATGVQLCGYIRRGGRRREEALCKDAKRRRVPGTRSPPRRAALSLSLFLFKMRLRRRRVGSVRSTVFTEASPSMVFFRVRRAPPGGGPLAGDAG